MLGLFIVLYGLEGIYLHVSVRIAQKESQFREIWKAGFSAAFLRIFKKAAEKLRIFLDLRKTCVFCKTAAEKLRLFF